MSGKVYLVGAGPGDEELITLKGERVLKEADIILYDRLSNSNLLAGCEAEKIYVGKKADKHYKTQAEINKLLVTKAQVGNIVVRLKGGDPFVFGRGGEEAQVLAANDVDFEIVPGITSPIAVPAYAGIPLTHRDFNSSVAFVTGHEDPTKEETKVDWERLSKGVETIVTLMGVGNLAKIVTSLIEAGRDVKTPVALISWGTTAKQKKVVGTLANIVDRVKEVGLKPPAITVIGENVKLEKKLSWFENKTLFGKNILVTRPKGQEKGFCQLLSREGANPIRFPGIKILPPSSYEIIDKKLNNLKEYDWIIFTSVNGVEYTLERLFELGKDVRALAGVKIIAIGSKTAKKLREHGLRVDYIPDEYRSEAILDKFSEKDLTGQKFLLPRADIARDILAEGLNDLGAKVDDITAYQVKKRGVDSKLVSKLKKGEVDIITFTSPSIVRNIIATIGDDYKQLLSGVEIVCIGPVTAKQAKDLGLNVDIVAKEYTIEGLYNAIVDYCG